MHVNIEFKVHRLACTRPARNPGVRLAQFTQSTFLGLASVLLLRQKSGEYNDIMNVHAAELERKPSVAVADISCVLFTNW